MVIYKNSQVLVMTSLLALSMSSNASRIQAKYPAVVDISRISKCKFLHNISAKSGYSKRNNWRRHTTHKLLLKAEESGATHLVISQVERIGVYNGIVYGKAYQCKIDWN